MTPALVLSGGGTKGAFIVGALEFLSRDANFHPQIMAGTSVGSLISGPLAQAENAAEFQQLVEVVRNNALAVTAMDSVFGRQPWLDEIAGTPMGDFVSELISVRSRPPLPPDPEGTYDPLTVPDPPRKHRTLFAIGTALSHGTALVKAGRALKTTNSSIMNLDPIEAGYRGESSEGVSFMDEDRVAKSGITLRITIASMRDGVARYVTETGDVTGPDALTPYPEAGRPGVIEGMCASSSVPMMFPPRRIGDDIYVDGGIVQNTPIEAAVRVGAQDVIAILTGPLETTKDDTDFTQASLVSIFARTASDIGPHELGRANLSYPLADGGRLRTIVPTADVLGGFETEAGLIKVDFDYGWLRAVECMSGADAQERQQLAAASDAITLQRERAWFAEERILEDGPKLNLVGTLRRARQHTVAAVTRWCQSGLPEHSHMHRWGHAWEDHRADVPADYESIALL